MTEADVPRWEKRFRAGRVGLPEWAEDAPDRCVVEATVAGVLEVHSFEAASGELRRLTDRPEGTSSATIDHAGEFVWWFDDTAGDEYGVWRRQPFGSAPGTSVEDPLGLPAAYPAGLSMGRSGVVVVGSQDDDYGTRIEVVRDGQAQRIYEHREDAWAGDLSPDEQFLAIAHSEHGDSRHPDLRVLAMTDGSTVAELSDGAGKGVSPLGFSPVRGDARLLVEHERSGRAELLVLDLLTGREVPIVLGVPGEVAGAEWTRDATGLVVLVDHEARTLAYRMDLGTGVVQRIGPDQGSVGGATARPDGDVWLTWSSAAQPSVVRNLAGDVLLRAPGEPAPESVEVRDVWVEGEGGRIHALLRLPAGADGPVPVPLPLVVEVHGGPTAHDTDAFRPYCATWVDEGFAVVQVNYRGSTGYGSVWRDALETRVGHVELADIAAVADHLVAEGIADPRRLVLAGASWGGFLTLLGLGTQPQRWALGLAGVPVADYVAAYEDEMEGLKAFDRSLFGGSPSEVPEKYADSSPLTYVDAVTAPVLVLAGRNDPRCPIRQIDNYLERLDARGATHEVYRYDAGHGSLLDDERVRQMRVELDFVRRHLP
ncbi:prolyl oligopeptidase family serine peptidase [Kineococcus sp. GCM10028916]|uniref:S9 family peptidase n=1 Tax=Kineococcus sp. GCM10028916 TaxID=3273394 RepID=UPI00363588D5